ncbi:putative major facilitator superfamily transporter [Diaporthe ampelina]|uniref:Putative major facilitator superfamily transporter n=1 Tax=Diaporthe ampelina TaxID=1214573 RepID=A0A0G2F8L8_9PEZI|nr:putative major facilitator superfamily transporter [Diaporthe ampelina]
MPHHDQPADLGRNGHTSKKQHVKSNDGFPAYQLTILAICRFSEPIAFNSILAYTYIMVQDLNGTDVNASFYAGLLVSAYAVAEALTSMITYWVALLARFIGGSLNGNVSVMQTMVAEMVKKPEHEPRAYAVQPFVWFLGSIIGSAMGGFLAQPSKFYPDVFPEDGLFGQYPYLLPNLVSVAVIVIAVIQGIIFLDETHPQFIESLDQVHATDGEQDDEVTPLIRTTSQPRSIMEEIRHGSRPLIAEEGLPTAADQRFDLRHNSFGTMHSIQVRPELQDLQESGPQATGPVKSQDNAFNFAVIMLILALVIAAFHQMAFGAILPIYLLDSPSYNSSIARSPQLDLSGGRWDGLMRVLTL